MKLSEVIAEMEKGSTPVTWHEAIQAWVDGKNVALNCGEKEYYILGSHKCLRVSKEQIANGTWYVED